MFRISLYCFFFFKQKTAYDMRISDWSSDVCSSDLAEGAALALAGSDSRLVVAKRKSKRATCAIAQAPQPIGPQRAGRERGSLAILGIGPGDTIGRATCRERVCKSG